MTRARGTPALALTVQFEAGADAMPRPATIRRWMRAALESDLVVTLRFVGTREARRLNKKYRRRD
jgi:ssRNA-specific RNase YbeY (16S rRNA maturation enzyme)